MAAVAHLGSSCQAWASRKVACVHRVPLQRRLHAPVQCSAGDNAQQSSDFADVLRKGWQPQTQQPRQVPGAGNGPIILGNDLSEETWREMDKKLNKYPGYRTFTAIGTGGTEFRASMVKAVEQVVGPVHVECVSQRPSSKGAYLSVKVGPVVVQNPEQVIQIFANMRKDDRLKWYM